MKCFFAGCIALLLHNFLSAQALTRSQVQQIQDVLKNEMDITHTPGLAISIINDNKVIYQDAFGIANYATNQAMTDTTIFQIASVTKIFTAFALLQSLEKNGLSIHDTVGSVIKDLSPRLAAIPFSELLKQTSGVIDSWPLKSDCNETVLNYFMDAGDAAIVDSSKNFSYSNNGFNLAGLVLATLENTTYAKAIQNIITRPLQMNFTNFNLYDLITKPFAMGYYVNASTGKYFPGMYQWPVKSQPAGGLYSNLNDLNKLAVTIMNNGMYNGTQVFTTKVLDSMLHGDNTVFSVPSSTLSYLTYPEGRYGYGSIQYNYAGQQVWGNAGEALTHNAFFFLIPEKKFGVIILSNRGTYLFINTYKKILEVVLGLKEKSTIFKPVNNYAELTGKYISPDISRSGKEWSEIIEQSGKLFMELNNGKRFELTQVSPYSFTFNDPEFQFPQAIAFYKNKDGRVAYLNYFFRSRIKE